MNQKLIMVFGALIILTVFSHGDDASATNDSTKITQTRKVTQPPFANYWDANSWEKGSGSSFWSAKPSKPKPTTLVAPKKDVSKPTTESKIWSRKAIRK